MNRLSERMVHQQEEPKEKNGRFEERGLPDPIFIVMRTRKGDLMRDFHYHATYELFYIKSGQAEFILDNSGYALSEGSILIIPPYVPHRSRYPEDRETYRVELQILCSCLSPNMSGILKKMERTPCYTLPLKYQAGVIRLFEKIRDESNSKEAFASDLCVSYLNEFLITANRYAVNCPPAAAVQESLSGMIMKYISENYSHPITINELASRFCVSDSTVYKNFKKHTGLKITDYINFTRIMNAERLIRETSLSLSEISGQCGFNDSNYFSTVFKRYKGVSPGRFIRLNRITPNH